jgi:hypothetical protein
VFQTGSTVNACTKGIWIWKDTLNIKEKEMEVLVLDTEGYGSANES